MGGVSFLSTVPSFTKLNNLQHLSMTYDNASKSGGGNGSIRFSSEISRAENAGLLDGLSLVEEAKKEIDSFSKGGPISYADLIQLAGQSAVKYTFLASAIRKCGGNEENGNLLYTAYGWSGQIVFDTSGSSADPVVINLGLVSWRLCLITLTTKFG